MAGPIAEPARWKAHGRSGESLCADSVLADRQGNLPKAASLLDSLRGIAEGTGDTDIYGFVAYTAGQLALHQSDHRQAVAAFENALAAFHADHNGLLFRIGALQGLGSHVACSETSPAPLPATQKYLL